MSKNTVLILILLLTSSAFVSNTIASQSTTLTEGKEKRPINIDTDRTNIYLQTQQTSVESGESATLIFSGTSYVTNNKTLTIQLLIQVPPGVSVSAARGAQEGSGSQFSTVKKLDPGEQGSIGVNIAFSNPGRYDVTAEAIYYFGRDRNSGKGTRVTIPIRQQPPPPSVTDRIVRTAATPFAIYGSLVAALASPVASGSYAISYLIISGIIGFVMSIILVLLGRKTILKERFEYTLVYIAILPVSILPVSVILSTFLPYNIRLFAVPHGIAICIILSISLLILLLSLFLFDYIQEDEYGGQAA
jgi:heme/copper-type cytochrome/quinol oxidase subunit 4